jgi:hypothetical protein
MRSPNPASRAVCRARSIGLENTWSNRRPARSLPIAKACRRPSGASGMSVVPVCCPEIDHSVSPCRTSQIAIEAEA